MKQGSNNFKGSRVLDDFSLKTDGYALSLGLN
jgi:hypothetical protein